MPEFYTILVQKSSKIPEFFMIFARKINKIPKFCMIFARKMPEFSVKIALKYLPPFPRLLRLCKQIKLANVGFKEGGKTETDKITRTMLPPSLSVIFFGGFSWLGSHSNLLGYWKSVIGHITAPTVTS